jgi:hypothetical protein
LVELHYMKGTDRDETARIIFDKHVVTKIP